MFKNPFQIAITFAIVALVIKLSIFSLGIQHGGIERYIFYIYIFLLLTTVFMGIRSNKINSPSTTSLGEDFRAGARTASTFAILVTIITYLYYAKIDTTFFEIKQAEVIEQLPEKIKQAFLDGSFSKEEILEKTKTDIKTSKMIFAPYFHAMATMMGLVFIGLFQSILFAFLMRKYPGFKK